MDFGHAVVVAFVGDPVPALLPPRELTDNESFGAPECAEVDRVRIQRVELGDPVHQRQAYAAADVVVATHQGWNDPANDLASPPLHDEEISPAYVRIVAEEVGAGSRVEDPPQPGQHAVLALHVVGARCQVAERWSAQDQLGRAEAEQVRQVGGTVGELQDFEITVGVVHVAGKPFAQVLAQVLAQEGGDAWPIEIFAGTYRSELGRCLVRERVDVGLLRHDVPLPSHVTNPVCCLAVSGARLLAASENDALDRGCHRYFPSRQVGNAARSLWIGR